MRVTGCKIRHPRESGDSEFTVALDSRLRGNDEVILSLSNVNEV